jgi:ABC-type uncharacterized transport system involved in gliding motility auxiliary subunit
MQHTKRFSIPWRSLRPLLWAGPILAIAGLFAGFVSGTWGATSLGLLISGGLICGLALLIMALTSRGIWGQRSTQASGNALIATLSILLILGLINFLAVRYDQRVDLTENQLFTLAPQSRQVIQTLKQPVKIWVFSPQIRPQDRELLENLQRQNPAKFSFELVNPQSQPGLTQSFGAKNFGDVYLESGKRRQLVQPATQGGLSESKLVNALAQSSSSQTQVYFLQGHGEGALAGGRGGFAQALSGLDTKSIVGKPLNLTQTGKIPADASAIVVAGPKRALFEAEVKALEIFLQQGGGLLLLIDPNTTTGLEPLLKDWGVKLDNAIAVDPSSRLVGLGPAEPLVQNYGNSPITQDFGNGLSFYPLSRPLEVAAVQGIQFTPLLLTGPQSWAETDLKSQELKFDPASGDRNGPLTLGVALTRSIKTGTPASTPSPTPSPAAEKEARLVVIGNSTFATNGAFEQQLNGDVFLNSVAWLSQRDTSILSIRPKEITNRRLPVSTTQGRLLSLVSMGVLPALAFSAAAWLWWRRR